MSIIPSIFNQNQSYTVIGDRIPPETEKGIPVSVVILNRGERVYKENQYAELEHSDFSEIISIEPLESIYDVVAHA